MLSFLVAACALAAAPEVNDSNFEELKQSICPATQEEEYLKIGWHASFFSAVNEARETNRPILLWAMNGHPLGCT